MKALKTTKRVYYKYVDKLWQRPDLTDNGTVGGSRFACEASKESASNRQAFQAFDDSTSTYWNPTSTASDYPQWITLYNPYPVRIYNMTLNFYATNSSAKSGYISASNDNTNWTQLYSFSDSGADPRTIDLSSNTNYYHYYRFTITAPYVTSLNLVDWRATETTLGSVSAPNAFVRIPQVSTSSNYDYYVDVDVCNGLSNNNKISVLS